MPLRWSASGTLSAQGHGRGVVAEVTCTGADRARDLDPPTGEQLREAVRHEHDRVAAACRPRPRHPVP
ncbi:hypothetical protein [Streptomyces sp. NPDC018584]|uniref:hypothetical protein n=1 Tax=unclassified Streptomyces TaxID=2593676 RepID=UPI0037A5E079